MFMAGKQIFSEQEATIRVLVLPLSSSVSPFLPIFPSLPPNLIPSCPFSLSPPSPVCFLSSHYALSSLLCTFLLPFLMQLLKLVSLEGGSRSGAYTD